MTITPQIEKRPPFTTHWWIPIAAGVVLSAIATLVGAHVEKRQNERVIAPLRAASERLDQYCSLMHITTAAVLEDVDKPALRATALRMWEDVRQYDARALLPCLLDTSTDQVSSCDSTDPACVRAEATFAWAHFEYGVDPLGHGH